MFSLELGAIDKTIDYALNSLCDSITIFSDSMSALQAIESGCTDTNEIQGNIINILNACRKSSLIWVPEHSRIHYLSAISCSTVCVLPWGTSVPCRLLRGPPPSVHLTQTTLLGDEHPSVIDRLMIFLTDTNLIRELWFTQKFGVYFYVLSALQCIYCTCLLSYAFM